jgi:hypothetical protein
LSLIPDLAKKTEYYRDEDYYKELEALKKVHRVIVDNRLASDISTKMDPVCKQL